MRSRAIRASTRPAQRPTRSTFVRCSIRTTPRHLLVNRATQGVYPTGLDLQADRRRGGPRIRTDQSLLDAGLHGHVHGRQPRLPQRRVERQRQPDAAAGTRSPATPGSTASVPCSAEQQKGHLYMQDWARRLGVGHPTGFDVPGEALPASRADPRVAEATRVQAARERIWYEGYSGQPRGRPGPARGSRRCSSPSPTRRSPTAGTVVRPHVGKAVLNSSGQIVRELRASGKAAPQAHRRLQSGSGHRPRSPVRTPAILAAVFGTFPVQVAGKTGTAEAPPGSDHLPVRAVPGAGLQPEARRRRH